MSTKSGVDLGDEMEQFKMIIDQTLHDKNITKKELLETLPKQSTVRNDKVALVTVDGIAITEKGKLTRAAFFDNLKCDREKYGDIVLTPEEARSLVTTYRGLSTGVNSVVPVRCAGEACPFKDDCWYFMHDKAPIGRPCLVEVDLLNYHTERFINEFVVDPEDHSEIMLVQELSELIIYEMRASRVLANAANAHLGGVRKKFSPDGDEIEEEVEHWAWNLKEKIKNRRMKIYEALNATRRQDTEPEDTEKEDNSYAALTKKLKQQLETINKINEAKHTEVEEVKDGN